MDDGVNLKNPWTIDNLDEYLFYCCPQCDHKSKSKPGFIDHALETHPEAKDQIKDCYAIKREEVTPSECNVVEKTNDVSSEEWETNAHIKNEHLVDQAFHNHANAIDNENEMDLEMETWDANDEQITEPTESAKPAKICNDATESKQRLFFDVNITKDPTNGVDLDIVDAYNKAYERALFGSICKVQVKAPKEKRAETEDGKGILSFLI